MVVDGDGDVQRAPARGVPGDPDDHLAVGAHLAGPLFQAQAKQLPADAPAQPVGRRQVVGGRVGRGITDADGLVVGERPHFALVWVENPHAPEVGHLDAAGPRLPDEARCVRAVAGAGIDLPHQFPQGLASHRVEHGLLPDRPAAGEDEVVEHAGHLHADLAQGIRPLDPLHDGVRHRVAELVRVGREDELGMFDSHGRAPP
jgi:hypothetical protein